MTTIYIATDGSDSNNGLSALAPVATISHAYTLMSPGDTLEFANGTYEQQLYPPVSLSGSVGSPTIFRATNPGHATIAPTSYTLSESALYVYSSVARGVCHHMTFIGFFVRGYGESYACRANTQDNLLENQLTHDIIFQRIGVFGRGRDTNVTAFELSNVKDCLVEDSYAYGFGRKAFEAFGCRGVTVRRLVTRYDWWEGDSYITTDPRNCFTAYNTVDSVFENIIAFDAGPHPIGVNPDRSGITASGNLTDVNPISGTSNCTYAGCLVINNTSDGVHNGVMINGGSGQNTENLTFKDIAVFNQKSFGFVVLNNVDGVSFDYITSAKNGGSGVYIDDNVTISNITIGHSYAWDNGSYGIYQGRPATITNTTYLSNDNQADLEASYAPTIDFPPEITYVTDHERGADLSKKYVDGTKTGDALWPWPYEDIIKTHMCNTDDLDEIGAAINAKNGTNITYRPGWASSNKTLTQYLYEYLGNTIPDDIYGSAPTASISGGNQTVSSTPITLSYTITPGDNPITSRSWSNDRGGSGTLSNNSGTFNVSLSEGQNVITLTVSDGTLSDESTVTITYDPPQPNTVFSGGIMSGATIH